MAKKTFRYAIKILGIASVLLVPTIPLMMIYQKSITIPRTIEYILLYLIPAIILVVLSVLTVRIPLKKIYLYALAVGFLISPFPIPVALSLLKIRNWFGGGDLLLGDSFQIFLLLIGYAFPFALLTIIFAIIIGKKRRKE